ncbi:MAG TPA: methylated-DNA--[protein]-cysteine S-methyltransferase [Lacipirellulaceae bacterium]|jgi:O-6-methylguanine DNA methyltransferase|nr:methylated-DNA--[protein]-cysteine S-methyltransferase [Lacipirellulaceae bacterium]
MHLRLEYYKSPLSPLLIVTDSDGALRALEFADHEERMHRLLRDHYDTYELSDGAAPKSMIKALDAYFEGELAAVDDVRVATGGTTFQRAVWRALRTIGAGATSSYGELAARIGNRQASRAVGAANGSNPIAIVVPCHRVIGANGTLTGYGGGIPRKRWLIDHERRHCVKESAMARGRVADAG